MKQENEGRERRRRRRVINQIRAYMTLIILTALLVTGVYFGLQYVIRHIKGYNQKVSEAIAEAESTTIKEQESSQEISTSSEEDIVLDDVQTDPLDELVKGILKDMAIEDMVAGMFIVNPESITGVGTVIQAGDGTKAAILENPVGGIIYSKKNFKSEEQFTEMLKNTVSYSKYPLFLAVMKDVGEPSVFGIEEGKTLSELTDTDSVKAAYSSMADILAKYGVNMNMAPASGVSAEGNAFSSDAATAAPLVTAALQAMQEKQVSAVLQKFPGNSACSKTVEELKNSEFIVYEMAIQAGVDCIMVSHVVANGISGDDVPSSMSSAVITDVLRNVLGFEGVVITDSMSDSAISSEYGDAVAAVEAVKAGADVIYNPADYKTAYEAVLQAVKDGTITKERIYESLYRIYKVKYKNALK